MCQAERGNNCYDAVDVHLPQKEMLCKKSHFTNNFYKLGCTKRDYDADKMRLVQLK